MADGVDRGGLNFPINIEVSQSINAVGDLKAQLAALQKQIVDIQQQARQGAAGGGTVGAAAAAAVGQVTAAVQAQNRAFQAQVNITQNAVANIRNYNREAREADGSTHSFSQALTDLGKRIAVFALFRIALREIRAGFRELVEGAIEFGASQERVISNTTAILTGVAQIRNAQGQLVRGAQAFGAAQGIAADQVRKLRLDALQTNSSFEDLAKTFNLALAPGLRAFGASNIDQVRQFTVGITQAADTIGLSTERLGREVVAIFAARQQGARTRLENELGISREALVRAKDAGTLFTFLQSKLVAFNIAGVQSAGTFDRLFSKLKNIAGLLLGEGGNALFQSVKGLVADLIKLVTVVGPDGVLRIRPETLQVIAAIDGRLAEVVTKARQLVANLDLNDVLAAARTLGLLISVAGSAISGVIVGASAALGALANFFAPLVGGLRQVVDVLFGEDDLVKFFGEVAGVLLVIPPILKTLAVGFGGLVGLGKVVAETLLLVPGILTKIGTGLALLVSPALATLAALATIAIVIGLIAAALAPINTSFGSLRAIIVEDIATGINGLFLLLKRLVLEAKVLALEFSGLFGGKSGLKSAVLGGTNLDKELAKTKKGIQEITNELINQQAIGEQNKRSLAEGAAGAKGFAAEIAGVASGLTGKLLEAIQTAFPKLADLLKTRTREAIGGAKNEIDAAGSLALTEPSFLEQVIFGRSGEGGLDVALDRMADAVTGVASLISGTINSLAASVSAAIVDAFDPTSKVDLKTRFAQFLKAIAQEILQFIIKLAIARALLAAFGSLFPGGAVATSVGGAAAGAAGSLGGLARGFAAGGPILRRPIGVHPGDTVPAWLMAGEYVHRTASVRKYGLAFMHALNQGAIDPGLVRALGSGTRSRASGPSGGPGYSAGGLVASAYQNTSSDSLGGQGPTVVRAIVVANEQTADRIFTGGKASLLKFMRENASDINTQLNRRKPSL
jgi:hypothetical protein